MERRVVLLGIIFSVVVASILPSVFGATDGDISLSVKHPLPRQEFPFGVSIPVTVDLRIPENAVMAPSDLIICMNVDKLSGGK